MNRMNGLKPCPFCGKYPQAVMDDETEEKFGVKCFNCGGSIYPEKETLQEAIEAWNRRADTVDVVRCKDCKWYGRADKRRFYRGMDCLQHRIGTIVPDKDFCSRAERREEA